MQFRSTAGGIGLHDLALIPVMIFKSLRLRSNSKTVSNVLKICTVILTEPVYLIHLDFNQLKSQAIFVILAVLVIKRVQCVLHKLHAKCGIIRTPTVTYDTLQKTKGLAC